MPTHALLIACLMFIQLTPANSQTTWVKGPDDPIIPHWTGGVDDPSGYKHVGGPSIVYDSTRQIYRAWFRSLSYSYGARGCISAAMSTDGEHWFLYARNPVLRTGAAGEFDYAFIYAGQVVFDGSEYKMYYTAQDENGIVSIGLATSEDGYGWVKHPNNPVLSAGPPGSWESLIVYAPHLLYDGTLYRMWYQGGDETYRGTGYATSTDGITWTKYSGNPVLTHGDVGSWDYLGAAVNGVDLVNDIYYMMYGGWASASGEGAVVGLATSTDGVSWTKHENNPVLTLGSPGDWDDRWIGGAELMFYEGKFHYWYSASTYSDYLWQTGHATSELDPTNVEAGDQGIPTGYRLYQSYPNPFNPEVTIRYALPQNAEVSIKVFNTLGEEVSTLVNEAKKSGTHSVVWNAANFPSGAYWYRLRAGTFTAVEEMMLVK